VIKKNAKQLLQATGGALVRGKEEDVFAGISIDSRNIHPHQLFICIRGERFDGHDFIAQAIEKKAAGIVLSELEKIPASLASGKAGPPFIIRVEDTLKALQDFAHFYRKNLHVRVIGVTGTNGKTTTKEMIASVCGAKFKTLKTTGNLNNHIGLPLTLLELEPVHKIAVLEMGMSDLGEIARLAEIAEPNIGVITNISEAHLLRLKTIKNVQKAKGELFEALNERGTAIVNADDPLILELAQSLRARKITFGIENTADVRARDIRPRENDGFDFTVTLPENSFPVHLPSLGRCNIYNALAAIATGYSLGLTPEEILSGLSKLRLIAQRGEITQHGSLTIINDTYNANPQSMLEAIGVLHRYKCPGRKFFVMGDMLELSDSAQTAHALMGEKIAGKSIDYLVTVGSLAAFAGEKAREFGMEKDHVMTARSHEEATDYLVDNTQSGDCLIFKGSRGSAMEKVIQGLTLKKKI
jgi:UDP-N-acetylmuramoyl-tripeptide--D-alanyl-D-alanine ligase